MALLVAAGHEVTGLARSAEKAGLQRQGARAVQASLFDPDALGRAVAGHDAVVNLATHIPVGSAAIGPRAEPLTRPQRVDSSRFAAATGWAAASRSTQGSWSRQPINAEM